MTRDAQDTLQDVFLAVRTMDRVDDILCYIRSKCGDVYEPEAAGQCGHICEDYPELVCRKRKNHKNRHDDKQGASW